MARILLAEDDSSMRQFLNHALVRAGHDVVAVEDGTKAMQSLEAGDVFHLLLADIVMPGMDGIELSKKAAKIAPGMKVMFITGFAGVAMGQNIPQSLHARVLSKPFHLSQLVDQVNQILADDTPKSAL